MIRAVEGCLGPEEIDALLDGRLPPADLARAEAHVDTCAQCRIVVGNVAQAEAPIEAAETAVERPTPRPRSTIDQTGKMPEHIGRYEIVKNIGAGGMGVVLLAEDSDLKRKVVIKLLRKEIVDDGRERLLREAQAMAKLSHPNVVPIYDVGVHDGQVFIAMEYLDGGDLATWLQTRREVSDVIDMLVPAGRGLAAAHRAGLVHRDFKPHNVLVGKTGEVKVTDFGLARSELTESGARSLDRKRPRVTTSGTDIFVASLLDSPLTESGTIVGTPAYMAPEQILAQFVDARTDQFSFCVALHEALYGTRPFAGRTSAELFEATLAGDIQTASDRRVPARIRDAVRRGLSVEPAERFPTMDALLAELSPRRRTLWVAGGLAAASIAGAVAVVILARQPTATCSGLEAGLAGAWDRAVAKQLQDKLTAAGVEASYPTIAAALDRYAKSWVDVRVDACRATRVRGDQSEDVLVRRVACLDARKVELGTLTARMLDDPKGTHASAARVTSTLTPTNDCSSTNVLAYPEASTPEAKQLQREIAELTIGASLGTTKVVRERLALLVAKADAQPHVPTRVETHFLAAMASQTQGDRAKAEAELRTAIQIAEVGGYDAGRARATIQLVYVLVNKGDVAGATNAVDAAEATLTRIGGNPHMAAELLCARAAIAEQTGKSDEALALLERALAEYDRLNGPDNLETARTLITIGGIHDRAHRDAEERRAMQRAEQIFAKLSPSKGIVTVVELMNEQSVADDAGDTRRALELAKRTLALMQTEVNVADPLIAVQYTAIGVYHYALEELPAARDNLLEAARRYEALGQHDQLSDNLDFAGRVVRDLGKYDEAIALFRRAAAALPPNSEDALDARRDLGSVLAEHGSVDEAIVELEWVLPKLEAKKADPRTIGPTRLAFAEALWRRGSKGDRERARAFAERAGKDADTANANKLRARVDAWLAAHK